MPTHRQIFLDHVAQTSELPLMLDVANARGMYIYDQRGKAYLDMNSGISVSSLGHCHPNVTEAIKNQVDRHLHTMVYGEHIQQPQIQYAQLLCSQLPESLSKVYYVMTGTETVEVAMKLSRRTTGRYEIIAAKNAYHGSTYGAEALRSDYEFTGSFGPGVPGVRHISFNDEKSIERITEQTAAVIIEPVQAESGINPPSNDFLKKVEARCRKVGALFILDEIQTGFGRTGELFAFMKYDCTPDMLLIAKGMGGGMPIGGVVSSKEIFGHLLKNPALGHITTFGGHPVSCVAAYATLNTLLEEGIIEEVTKKEAYFLQKLQHPIIKEIRHSGLMMGVELTRRKYLKHVVAKAFELGLLIDFFLFNDRSFRLAPPLIVDYETIDKAVEILLESMDFALNKYKKN